MILPLCACFGVVVSHGSMPVTHALFCVSASWSGFTMNWYAVGSGRPAWITAYDVLPRLSAALLSAIAILLTGKVWIYPLALLILLSTTLTRFHRRQFGSWLPAEIHTLSTLTPSERVRGAALSLVGAAYSSAPLPVAQALSLAGSPALASTDRLYRYALYTVSSLANALQEWVLSSKTAKSRLSGHIVALRLHVALGLVGAGGIASLGPTVGRLMFGNDVAPSHTICGGYAVAFFFVSVSTPLTRNVLVVANRTDVVLRSAAVSGLIAVVLMATTGRALGAPGISWSLACGDFLFFLLMAPIARRLMKEEATHGFDE
ncbi:MAG: hypothetical protein K1X67_01670 [Fimbriimonadaceae bacterium]|nr:hypothetical protein [Fimbriimonadaceae bacterium]